MMCLIFVLLLLSWLAGMIVGFTLHGFLHVLLVLAVVVMFYQLRPGRTGATQMDSSESKN